MICPGFVLAGAFTPAFPTCRCSHRVQPSPRISSPQGPSGSFAQRRILVVAQSTPTPGGDPDPQDNVPSRQGPIQAARDFLAGISRVAGIGISPDDSENFFEIDPAGLFDDAEEPPIVLVVGATGETGRIVVRKLLLRGYKVRVLVRNLYSSTLDVLGSGVTFVKGDLLDYDSLLEAVVDVDKVICAVSANNGQPSEQVDYTGVSNLIRAFQDARASYYGRLESTKIRLFDFARDDDLSKWKVLAQPTGADQTKPPRVALRETTNGRIAFLGQVHSIYSGFAEIRTVPAKFNFLGFGGLIIRCIGDGKTFRVVLRTVTSAREGVEFVATFTSLKEKWETVRIPFSNFVPRSLSDGMPSWKPLTLDRSEVRQMAIQYAKPFESPEKDDGRFYLALDYIKTYRSQDEPDFVLVSCATVSNRDKDELDNHGARELSFEDSAAWKYMAEKRLRNSGLSYCIVRPGTFNNQPGGTKALVLEQDSDMSGVISRADLAEICVKSLLDRRACNVTFDAFESMYAPSAQSPNQDMGALLGRLQQNT